MDDILKRLDVLESKVAKLSGDWGENCSTCSSRTVTHTDGWVNCQWWGEIPSDKIKCQHYKPAE